MEAPQYSSSSQRADSLQRRRGRDGRPDRPGSGSSAVHLLGVEPPAPHLVRPRALLRDGYRTMFAVVGICLHELGA
jgi:hypothetical protein